MSPFTQAVWASLSFHSILSDFSRPPRLSGWYKSSSIARICLCLNTEFLVLHDASFVAEGQLR
jgi:hypothetical protein